MVTLKCHFQKVTTNSILYQLWSYLPSLNENDSNFCRAGKILSVLWENYQWQDHLKVNIAVKYKVMQMEMKLRSGKNLRQSQSKMVKNFIIDSEMTELLPFKY
jgi:hypothetical protein